MAFVALITGASSGIGEATARRLARGVGGDEVKLILVARREDRLRALADELGGATVIAIDLTEADAPAWVRDVVEREHGGELHMLVNNAGAAWRGKFAETGWANIERHMKLNFESPVRLTEALLPLLRSTAARAGGSQRVSIVNVASTAARVSRPGSAAYSASKFALIGWSDGLHVEEAEHGVHVGVVLPGFIRTEGFPAAELPKFMVSEPEIVAEAIYQTGPGGKAERYVPRPYFIAAALRILAPAVVRRALARGGLTTATSAKED
jgi:short-subunit dehydrogenase